MKVIFTAKDGTVHEEGVVSIHIAQDGSAHSKILSFNKEGMISHSVGMALVKVICATDGVVTDEGKEIFSGEVE